jgi:hypothetical protein
MCLFTKETLGQRTSRSPVNQRSNGNDIATKANESFDNGVFFDIEAMVENYF